MGTRSTIEIKDGKQTLVKLYTQYDGYPDGVGEQIFKALNKGNVTLLNGFSSSSVIPKEFNGMRCLGAFLIGKLKGKSIGNVYLTDKNDSQEFDYVIYDKDNQLYMKINYGKKILYNGLLKEFKSREVQNKLGEE